MHFQGYAVGHEHATDRQSDDCHPYQTSAIAGAKREQRNRRRLVVAVKIVHELVCFA
jgi:hypothetical protein